VVLLGGGRSDEATSQTQAEGISMALDQLDQINRMARLVEENWAAAWASLAAARATPPTLVDTTASCLRVYTPGVPESLLNLVIGYHGRTGPKGVSGSDLERVIAPFRQWRLPFQWWMTRGAEPTGLRQRLSELGMESWGGATMMCLTLDRLEHGAARLPQAPASAALDRILTADESETALSIICEVFAIPREPMRRWTTSNPAFDLWIARLGARPVAALATLRQGATVGVYHVATQSGARRRGLAGALLVEALRDARELGCLQATLTATPEARSLYERLGFQVCGVIEQWMPGYSLSRQLSGEPVGW
jgi:GNAT superfamily N-acetyltransferase